MSAAKPGSGVETAINAPDFAALNPGYLLDEFLAACDKSKMVSRYVSRDEER